MEQALSDHCHDLWRTAGDLEHWAPLRNWLRNCHQEYSVSHFIKEGNWGKKPLSWLDLKLGSVRFHTRSFGEVGVVPVVDFANTDTEHNSKVSYGNDDGETPTCLVATRTIQHGMEVLVDYGEVSTNPLSFFL